MPRRSKPSINRWPLADGSLYGYVESRQGRAVYRYNGTHRALGMAFDPRNRTDILAAARKVASRMKAERDGFVETQKRKRERLAPGSVLVSDAWAEYWKAKKFDTAVKREQLERTRMFEQMFPVDFTLTDDTLHQHLITRLPKLEVKYAANTMSQMAMRLTQFVDYCRYRKWLTVDPWQGVERPTRPELEPAMILSDRDIWRMLRWLMSYPGKTDSRQMVALLVNLLNHTGMRLGEALSLRWVDLVDDPTKHNTISADKIHLRYTKSGDVRIYPISPDTIQTERIRRAVERLLPHKGRWSDRVFGWQQHASVEVAINQAATALNIDVGGQPAHIFRATCEHRWDAEGVPEDLRLRIIGHSKRVYDRHYRPAEDAAELLAKMKRG